MPAIEEATLAPALDAAPLPSLPPLFVSVPSDSLRSPGYSPVLAHAASTRSSAAPMLRDLFAWHTIGKATTLITYNIG
jgi:hypothetical protein